MENIYFKYKNRNTPGKGRLLISEPFLPDPNFMRTVILLCEFSEEGAFGFIINKLTELKFSEIMPEADGFDKEVFLGGPVQQDTLHFLHKAPDLIEGGAEIAEGLYWGGDYDELNTIIDTHQIREEDFKFFIGYSGWGPGQLEKEIEENSWIVTPDINVDDIFNKDPDELWKKSLSELGGRFKMFSKYPSDPRLN